MFREPKESDVISDSFISIELDCELNEQLIDEGLARVINRIQKTRKELDFKVEDRINVQYACSEGLDNGLMNTLISSHPKPWRLALPKPSWKVAKVYSSLMWMVTV